MAIATGLFLLMATVLVLVTARLVTARAAAQVRSQVSAAVDGALGELADSDFDTLYRDDFSPPSPCPADEADSDGAGSDADSCLVIGTATHRVDWTAARGSNPAGGVDWLELSGTVSFADGSVIVRSRRVPAPAPGYLPGTAAVRVTLDGDLDALGDELVYLVDADTPAEAVASAAAGPDGVILFRLDPAACTEDDPCRVALRAGDQAGFNDDVALAAADVVGPGAEVVAVRGGLTERSATVFARADTTVALTAENPGGGVGAPTVAGSVCLWGRFHDGVSERTVPLCNHTDPAVVTVGTYDVDGIDLAIDPTTTISLHADHPDGTCLPSGGVSHIEDPDTATPTWGDVTACLSWTWGTPTSFDGDPFTDPTFATGAAAAHTLLWDDTDDTRPAAGYAGQSTWSYPREAPACAWTGTCQPDTGPAPEPDVCPGEHCYSIANSAPRLTAPNNGGQPTVGITSGGANPVPVTFTDPDGDPVTVSVAALPPYGSLTFGGSPVTVGQVLVSGVASPSSLTLTFQNPPGQTTLAPFVLTASDGKAHGTGTHTIGMYHQPERIWTVTGSPLQLGQGAGGTATATTRTVTGGTVTGAVLTVSGAPAGMIVPATVTTGPGGGVSLPVAVGAQVTAGTYPLTLTTANGRTGTVTVTVTQTAGSLTVTATDLAQGASGSATVVALDRAGAPMRQVSVRLASYLGGDLAERSYPRYSACVTDTAGTCTSPLLADLDADATGYTLQATSGSFTATDGYLVTPTVTELRQPAVTVAQGDDVDAVLTVLDGAGDPVPGVAVTAGAGELAVTGGTTTAAGQVTATVAAATDTPAGRHVVTVTAGDLTSSLRVEVTPVVTGIEVRAVGTLTPGGTTSALLVTTDATGAPVPAATVDVDADPGLRTPATVTAGPDGSVTLLLEAAHSAAPGTRTVTLAVGDVSSTFDVEILAGVSSVSLSGAARQGATTTGRLLVTDRTGRPVAGRTLTVSIDGGGVTVDPAAVTTTDDGTATVTFTTGAAASAGTRSLLVTDGTTTVAVAVAVTAVAEEVVGPDDPVEVPAGGAANFTLVVTGDAGQPIRGATPSLTTPRGLTTTAAMTDGAGRSLVEVRATDRVAGRSFDIPVVVDGAVTVVTVTVAAN